jgi:hypothetical protein
MCWVYEEAVSRGYRFDGSKIDLGQNAPESIPVSLGQMNFEGEHLRRKLVIRDPERLQALAQSPLMAHPLFVVVPGEVEPWEKTD